MENTQTETMGLMDAGGCGYFATWTDGELFIIRDTYCLDRFDALVCLIDYVIEYECDKRGWKKRDWGWVYTHPRSRFRHGRDFNPLDEIFVEGQMEKLLCRKYEMAGYDGREFAQ